MRLVDRLREYLLIGGLPEVVKSYARTQDLRAAQTSLDDLIVTIKDDFAKYKDRAPVARLTEVFESLVFQAGNTTLPVEVKAGTKGQMQSVRLFMAERGLSKGIRTSLENFGTLGDIDILPLYAIRRLSKAEELL